MRARYDSLESADAIDSLESEADLLSSKVSIVTEVEYIAPSSVADPSPSGETTVSAIDRIDASNVTYEPNQLGGELQFVGSKTSILGAMTHQWVAFPTPGNDTLHGTGGNDIIDGGDGNDVIYGLGGNDLLLGGAGGDFVYGDSGNDRLEGQDGHDRLWGGEGDDVIFGGAGNDRLIEHSGINHLYGGDGDDGVQGGGGIDYLSGDAGDDRVRGEFGDDMIWGGDGNDTLSGGYGADILNGGAGNDELNGNDDADMLFGGAGDDTILGDYSNEIAGADVLYGEDGSDKLYGGGGNDQLNGGAGSDRLTGGGGRDVFVFTDRPIQGPAYFELDVIGDFVRSPPPDGGDVVDMRALFDQFTDFTGTTAEQAAIQGYLYFVQQAHGGTRVYIDPNGNAPDPTTYYQYHDIAVVDLEGVAPGELGSYAPHYGGLSNHFLV